MSAPRVTVIIPTYRRPALLERLLEDLSRQSRWADELVVVDGEGGSPDVRLALERSAWVRGGRPALLIRSALASLPFQRYVGRLAASGDAVLYFDDDVRLRSADVVELLAGAIEAGAAGATAPIDLGTPPPTPSRLARRFGGAAKTPPGGLALSGARLAPVTEAGRPYAAVEWLRGGAMAFRAEALPPESFPAELLELARQGYGLGEDLILARIARSSGELWLAVDALVDHPGDDPTRCYATIPWKRGFARAASRRRLRRYLAADRWELFRTHLGAVAEAALRRQPGRGAWIAGYLWGVVARLPGAGATDWEAEARRSLQAVERIERRAA